MDWGGYAFLNQTAITAGSSFASWIISPETIATSFVDPTIMAIRAQVGNTPVSAGAYIAAHGIIAWSGTDLVTLPNPLPSPLTDPELDWMWHQYSGGTDSTIATSPGIQTLMFDISEKLSKARRRMGNQMGLLYVFSNSFSSETSLTNSAGIRYLLKE
jgi:hypothetical protein